MLSRGSNIIKSNQYSYDVREFEMALVPHKAPYTAVIKRYQIDYSYEQKYKLGILSPAEYYAWQTEIALKKQEEALENRNKGSEEKFWKYDVGDRENVSEEEYNDFLENNHLDVSNENKVDVEALLREQTEKEQQAADEPAADQPEAAAAMTMPPMEDLPGSDDPNRVLTPEEIAALFAAMGEGG